MLVRVFEKNPVAWQGKELVTQNSIMLKKNQFCFPLFMEALSAYLVITQRFSMVKFYSDIF